MQTQPAENIQVFVRCRPLQENEGRSVLTIVPERHEVKVCDRSASFYYDRVFSMDSEQNEVYRCVVKPLMEKVLLGFNCTVFAYGQTGTGKTYTMEGERSNDKVSWEDDPDCGIIPRSISHLFDALSLREAESSVKVSFLELYNEDIYDLLSPIEDTTKLKIFDNANRKGSVIIEGMDEKTLETKEEIYEVLRQGSAKRQTAATLLNACSSRSHTIFSISVQLRNQSCPDDGFRMGKINLVDLAGSENIGRSGAQNKQAREAGNINQSLLTLGRVVTALVEKRPHIPYRESKLTRILQDSLGGTATTSIIATVSPSEHDLSNTVSTLDYASRARCIANRPDLMLLKSKNSFISTRDIQHLMERHQADMNELEFKVRNEVAVEFRREIERLKLDFEQLRETEYKTSQENHRKELERLEKQLDDKEKQIENLNKILESQRDDMDSMKQRHTSELEKKNEELRQLDLQRKQESKQLDNRIRVLEKEIEQRDTAPKPAKEVNPKEIELLQNELAIRKREALEAKSLADYRQKLNADLEIELKNANLKLQEVREELKNKPVENNEIAGKKTRVRGKRAESEGSIGYADMTFDQGVDELCQVSAKKPRKKIVPGAKKRIINETITLSGKKKKLRPNDDVADLSPVEEPPENARVTRSRATRRKLQF